MSDYNIKPVTKFQSPSGVLFDTIEEAQADANVWAVQRFLDRWWFPEDQGRDVVSKFDLKVFLGELKECDETQEKFKELLAPFVDLKFEQKLITPGFINKCIREFCKAKYPDYTDYQVNVTVGFDTDIAVVSWNSITKYICDQFNGGKP